MPSTTRQPTSRVATSPAGSPPRPALRAEAGRSLRVLQVAFACHPEQSMETRIGWQRAIHAARRHDVTVLHGCPENEGLLNHAAAELGLSRRLRFVAVERCSLGTLLNRSATTYYLGYRLWHHCALQVARGLHREEPFDLVHQTTFCGFREPGDCWKLGPPFVWGPVGGTQAFPTAYLSELGLRDAWIELLRNALNAWQLRFSRRVRAATRRAAVLVAATEKAAADIHRTSGRRVPVRLETALDVPVGPPREPRAAGEPLRVLWSGRLRAWKTLPLLLRALAALPDGVDYRLRVLGVGPCQRGWARLADRLGIADRVEWRGWPNYRETLPHYRWADAFAFTSMRDTSGTGLLEALAAGTPIVGVDHQGAADLMTPDCALAVPVGDPRTTIDGFAAGLTRLAHDRELWRRLSDGARAHAGSFLWERQAESLLDWYAAATRTAPAGAPAGATHAEPPSPGLLAPAGAPRTPAAG